jgi:hypothetical protein
MDEGEEAIDDAAVLAQVRRQARKVLIQAVVTALALTAVVLALPAPG